MMRVAGGRGARPGPPPRAGGPLVRKAAVRRRLRQPTSGASLSERGGAGEWGGGGGTACTLGGGGGGGCGLVGGHAREGDGGAVSSAAERHRAADRAEERLGLAKVGRGARGARGVGGAAVSGGARTPLGGDESRRASSTGANPGGGGGERHAVPSRPNRTGTGPAGWIPGGRAGLGTGAPGPGSLVVVGRRGGDRAGPWAAAGEGGRGRAGRARGRTPRGPRGLGEGSRGRPFLEGGGGLLPARGTTGAPLERGGGGRACIARCRAMSIHGRAAWDYIPNPPRRSPFFGGAEGGGGGGWRLLCAPSLVGGGSPVGAPSGLAEKTRWRPLGPWAPSRKNLGFAGGDSAI